VSVREKDDAVARSIGGLPIKVLFMDLVDDEALINFATDLDAGMESGRRRAKSFAPSSVARFVSRGCGVGMCHVPHQVSQLVLLPFHMKRRSPYVDRYKPMKELGF
jgi:hypothetical protein